MPYKPSWKSKSQTTLERLQDVAHEATPGEDINDAYPARSFTVELDLNNGSKSALIDMATLAIVAYQRHKAEILKFQHDVTDPDPEDLLAPENWRTALYEFLNMATARRLVSGCIIYDETPPACPVEVISIADAISAGYPCTSDVAFRNTDLNLVLHIQQGLEGPVGPEGPQGEPGPPGET